MKPNSVSYAACVSNSTSKAAAVPFDAIHEGEDVVGDNRALSKSNVFLRAARSITKTKSISGNFIVKTTICKQLP